MLKKLLLSTTVLSLSTGVALAQIEGQFPAGTVFGNSTGSAARAAPSTVTAIIDQALGSTRGSILERGASGWQIITPGTAGLPWISGGAGADGSYTTLSVSNLTGTALPASIVGSSLTSVGIITTGTWSASAIALSFIGNVNADSVVGNPTSTATTAASMALPSCSGGQQALLYNTTTHAFGCNTISGSGTVISGAAGNIAWYSGSTNVVMGNPNVNMAGTPGQLILGQQAGPVSGLVSLYGFVGGLTTIQASLVSSSPTLTLPTTVGTFAVTGTSPISVNVTTGNITCITCATTTSGGQLAGSLPIAISNAGLISISGAGAGKILAGSSPAFTPTPTLGAATVTGSLSIAGTTSGVVTIIVAQSAGTWSLQLPTSGGTSGQYLGTDGTGIASWSNPPGTGTVSSGLAGQLANYAVSGSTVSGNANLNVLAGALTLGQASSTIGQLILATTSPGSITVTPPTAMAASYNFNLPNHAGTTGSILLSGSTVTAPMSWSTDASSVATLNGGPLTINSTAASLKQGLIINQSVTGSPGNIDWNSINLTSDTVSGSFLVDLAVRHSYGGASTNGARVGILGYLIQTNATSTSNASRSYVGIEGLSESSTGDGGTNTGAGSLGAYFGANVIARSNGATNVFQLAGIESDIFGTGASSQKYVMAFTAGALHVNQGASLDAAYEMHTGGVFGGYGPGAGFGFGLVFAELNNGLPPIVSTGTLIGTHFESLSSVSVSTGIDFTKFAFSGNAFATTGFSVSGSGALTLGAGTTVKSRSSAAATVVVSATADYFLCLDPTSNAIAANLPATPATGLTYLIKDCTGQAAAHNITITPNSGNIDGNPTFVMTTAYQSVAVTYTGSQWSIN